jgi:hypothetical protein
MILYKAICIILIFTIPINYFIFALNSWKANKNFYYGNNTCYTYKTQE